MTVAGLPNTLFDPTVRHVTRGARSSGAPRAPRVARSVEGKGEERDKASGTCNPRRLRRLKRRATTGRNEHGRFTRLRR